MPLINCEIELILDWPKHCVLDDMKTGDTHLNADPAVTAIVPPTGLEIE